MWTNTAHKVHNFKLSRKKTLKNNKMLSDVRLTPFIIGVCGGAGSGKSTFCKEFVEIIGTERAIHISQDSYYKDLSHIPVEDRLNTNFDHPEQIDFSLLAGHLDQLFLGKSVSVPKYNFSTCEREPSFEILFPRPIIIVEGILIFFETAILKRMDYKLFIDAKEDTRLQRKIIRDINERGRTKDFALSQYQQCVKPMHQLFVENSKNSADKIISGEEPFDLEIRNLLYKVMDIKN